jgi:hypothetical protein
MVTRTQPAAMTILQKTVDNLRIDSGWLRMNSRDEADATAASLLETASNKIFRMSNSLERLARTLGKVDL